MLYALDRSADLWRWGEATGRPCFPLPPVLLPSAARPLLTYALRCSLLHPGWRCTLQERTGRSAVSVLCPSLSLSLCVCPRLNSLLHSGLGVAS